MCDGLHITCGEEGTFELPALDPFPGQKEERTYLRLEDVSGCAREHGAVDVEVGVGEGLVVHGDHLDAARPHAKRVEVGRVDPHARGVHPHQLKEETDVCELGPFLHCAVHVN